METFATIFAGLGLFFIGLNGLTKGMRALASRRLHRLVQAATSNCIKSSLAGILSGAITQSSTAITFIAVSMVSSGVITLLPGLFVTAWSNIGTSALVFVATLDLHFYLEIFIGALGVSYYFGLDRTESHSNLLSLLVGLALLMLGLVLIKQGAAGLKENFTFLDNLGRSSGSILLLLLVGTLIGLVTQSATSASAIVVTLVGTGILNFHQAAGVILGANLGAGICIYFIGYNLSGSAKKMVVIQTLTKSLGVFLLTPVLFYQVAMQSDALENILALNGSALLAVTLFVVLLQVVSALAISLIARPLVVFLHKQIVEDETEETRKPKYLHKLALDDGESALDLLEKEQLRVISFFPRLLESPQRYGARNGNGDSFADSVTALIHQCDEFCLELINKSHNPETLGRVLKAQKRNSTLSGINTNLELLIHHLQVRGQDQTSASLKNTLQEGLHFILMMFGDSKHDTDELDILKSLTGDKSAVMEKARETLVLNREQISEENLSNMLSATSQFERVIWLIHSYAEDAQADSEKRS